MHKFKHGNTRDMENQEKVTLSVDHNTLVIDSKDVEMGEMSDK